MFNLTVLLHLNVNLRKHVRGILGIHPIFLIPEHSSNIKIINCFLLTAEVEHLCDSQRVHLALVAFYNVTEDTPADKLELGDPDTGEEVGGLVENFPEVASVVCVT